jgi:hypothetical protein
MSDQRLTFYIDAYSPETIPMAKLAAYMADFAALLGKDNAVHFDSLAPGSTKIKARVEFEDVPKVTHRLDNFRRGNPPKDAVKLFAEIDNRLANDNAVGLIWIDGADGEAGDELLAFPGRDRPKAQSYGPFTQEGSLDGLLISIGGKDESISLRLLNGDTVYSKCETTRSIARELGKHLFEPVRIHGSGRWTRETDGAWTLVSFRATRFDTLDKTSLRDLTAALRAVKGSKWKEMADPLAELADMRCDESDLH